MSNYDTEEILRLEERVKLAETALRDQALALSRVSEERDALRIGTTKLRARLKDSDEAFLRERERHFDVIAGLEHEIRQMKGEKQPTPAKPKRKVRRK